MKKRIIIVLLLILGFNLQAQELNWIDDVDEAIAVSKKTNKPILQCKNNLNLQLPLPIKPKPKERPVS